MTDLSEVRLVRTDGDSTLMHTDDERADAADWLTGHGWRVDAVPSADEMTRLGRPAGDDLVEEAIDSVFVHALHEGDTR